MDAWQIGLTVAGILSPFILVSTIAVLRIWWRQGIVMEKQAAFETAVNATLVEISKALGLELKITMLEHEKTCTGFSITPKK